MANGTKKHHKLHNGVELVVDSTRFTLHEASASPTLTAVVCIHRGNITEADLAKAAHRVSKCTATKLPKDRKIHLSTNAAVRTARQATIVTNAFIRQLDELLKLREQAARNIARSSGDGAYKNRAKV